MDHDHKHSYNKAAEIFLLAFIVIIAIVGLVSLMMTAVKDHQLLNQKIEETTTKVNELANRFDADEEFINKLEVTPLDAWGRTITISIEGEAIKTCSVVSAGPDSKFDTKDDIAAINRNMSIKSVGGSVGKTGGEFGIGIFKGVISAVKDEFTKKE
jgi:hypothetical protein